MDMDMDVDVVVWTLDLGAVVTATVAARLWYTASTRAQRRISRFERLDAADLNRIITGINRSALLNRRAALATAVSSAFVALRFAVSLLGVALGG